MRARYALVLMLLGLSIPASGSFAAEPYPWSPQYNDWLIQRYQIPPNWADGNSNDGCGRDKIGAALGGAIGGFIGSKIGEDSGQQAATAFGAVVGFMLGSRLGAAMDEQAQCPGSQNSQRAQNPPPMPAPAAPVVPWAGPSVNI